MKSTDVGETWAEVEVNSSMTILWYEHFSQTVLVFLVVTQVNGVSLQAQL